MRHSIQLIENKFQNLNILPKSSNSSSMPLRYPLTGDEKLELWLEANFVNIQGFKP